MTKASIPWILNFSKKILVGCYWRLLLSLLLSALAAMAIIAVGERVELDEIGELFSISLGAGAVIAARLFSNLYRDLVGSHLSRKAQVFIAERVIDNISALRMKFSVAEITHRLTVNCREFAEAVVHGSLQMITTLTATLILAFYVLTHFSSSLVKIGAFLVLGLGISFSLQWALRRLTDSYQEMESEIFRQQQNLVRGGEYLKVSQQVDSWRVGFAKALSAWQVLDRKVLLLQHSSGSINWGAKYLFVLLIISPLVMAQDMAPSIIYWLYVMLGFVTQLFLGVYQLGQTRTHAERSYELLEPLTTADARQKTKEVEISGTGVSVYFGAKQRIHGLHLANFDWHRGDRIWIEGASGAGKSTLLRSLVGLHDNYSGNLVVPDRKVKLSYLEQQPFFFDGDSLGNNLGLQVIDEKTKAIVEGLGLQDFFTSISWDLDTLIGQESFQPSKGQMIRLALLRELLRNPSVILLDEPTANLDEVTSQQVMSYLSSIAQNKLVVICEHKTSLKLTFNPTETLRLGCQVPNPSHARSNA